MNTTIQNSPRESPSQIAARSADHALRLVANYGHLRAEEVALARPHASPYRSRLEMARRTLARLAKGGFILERRNLLGGRSYVLTERGAAYAVARWGLKNCRDGYDISSVRGPTWFHRTVSSAFLCWKGSIDLGGSSATSPGDECFGEYALAAGRGPVSIAQLASTVGRLPDGLVVARSEAFAGVHAHSRGGGSSLPDPIRWVDWIETENTFKSREELEQVFSIAWRLNLPIAPDSNYYLDRLVFVYDPLEGHEGRICRAALAAARSRLPTGLALDEVIRRSAGVLESVDLVRASIQPPFTVTGFESTTLLEVLTAGPDPRPEAAAATGSSFLTR